MIKLKVVPVHPKEFRKLHGLSIYQMSRLSGYPVETIKRWVAEADSKRYVEPRDGVKNHFGVLSQVLQRQVS